MNMLYTLISSYNIYFGGYPDEEEFMSLLEKNIQIFVDLTTEREKKDYQLFPYHKLITYYKNYPIRDRSIPKDKIGFSTFLYRLYDCIMSLKADQYIYIHCKGGHGRSGMVIACLLRLLNPEWKVCECLYWTKYFHNQRRRMKKKYYEYGCPNLLEQRIFLKHFLEPIVITDCYYKYYIKRNLISFLQSVCIRPIIYPTNQTIQTSLNDIRKNYFIQ